MIFMFEHWMFTQVFYVVHINNFNQNFIIWFFIKFHSIKLVQVGQEHVHLKYEIWDMLDYKTHITTRYIVVSYLKSPKTSSIIPSLCKFVNMLDNL